MNDEHTRARFETLMLPLMNDAYNLARWLMKNQEDAEDMVQESYLRAFRFFTSFQGTKLPRLVAADCAKPVLHCFRRSQAERQGSAARGGGRWDRRSFAPAPVSLVKKATVEAVREAIAALPVDFREAVVLRELEGLSYKEISEVTEVPIGYNVLHWARDGFEFWAVCDVNAGDLRAFADLEMKQA
jgi:RNA polymerase sigma-70 factor (ECF subfamily)